jgi:hypothetical protein
MLLDKPVALQQTSGALPAFCFEQTSAALAGALAAAARRFAVPYLAQMHG